MIEKLNFRALLIFVFTTLLLGCDTYDPASVLDERRTEECLTYPLSKDVFEFGCEGESIKTVAYIIGRDDDDPIADLGGQLRGEEEGKNFIIKSKGYFRAGEKVELEGVIKKLTFFGGKRVVVAHKISGIELTDEDKKLQSISERKKEVEESFSKWDGSHIELVKYIKKNMKDPSSFKHVSTTYQDMGDSVLLHMEFRGTNSFGATVTQSVSARATIGGKLLTVGSPE